MVRELTDSERKEIDRLLRGQGAATSSRFAPAAQQRLDVAPTPQPSRFSKALTAGGNVAKFLLSGKSAVAAALPGVEESDIENLPAPVEFAIDNLLSPVGLASLALAPVTGGGSIAAKVGLGAALASKPLAVRAGVELAGRIATDLAVAGVGNLAAKGVDKALPEDTNPALRTALTIGAGLAGGMGTAVGISKAFKPTLVGTKIASAIERGDTSLPELPDLVQHANAIGGPGPLARATGPLGEAVQQGINPSRNQRTFVGKLAVARTQQQWSIDQNVKAYIGAHFPKGFEDLYLRNGEALVNGERVNWLKAITNVDDLAESQKPVATAWRKTINSAIDTFNETVEDVHKLSYEDIWRPKYSADGQVIASAERKFKDFVATAQGMKLTRAELEDPATLLHVYTKTALTNKLNKRFDDAIEPLLRTSDDVLAYTDEGKELKANFDAAQEELRRFRNVSQVVMPIPADLKRRISATRKAWQKYKRETVVTESTSVPWGGSDPSVKVSRYKGRYLIDDTGEIEAMRKWTQNLSRGGSPIPGFNAIQEAADATRFLQASADASGPFINLLPMMFYNPRAWSKAIVGNWRALIYDPDLQLRYLSKNYDDVVEMINHGVAAGDIENFISTARGGLAHKALGGFGNPVAAKALSPVKAAFQRFQSGYETGLLIGRVEAWKAFKADPTFMTPDGPDLRRIADFVRESTGAWDSAYFGVSPTQRTVESIAFFSPRMFRSMMALAADAARPWTPEGAAAAHTIMRMMSAGTGLFLTANALSGKLAGKSDAEIAKDMEESANPLNGRQFLSVKVGDEWYGIGGQVRAMSQALSRWVSDEDEKAGKDNNPIWDFFSGRLGPAPRSAAQLIEATTDNEWAPYERLENFPDWMEAQALGLLPFYVQNALQENGLPGLASPKLLVDVAGLSSKPRTSSDVLNSAAYQRHNMSWSDLTAQEQDELRADHPELEDKSKDLMSNEDLAYRAAIKTIDTRTSETLVAINSANLAPEDKRKRIDEVLRDRWLQNKTTSENFNRASNLGPADTPKRAVLDAYYKTFEDAAIGPKGTTQTDWQRWEELQADLDLRIRAGDFGDPKRAQEYLDERRKFELPEELDWYTKSKEVLKSTNYWAQKDVAFAELSNVINGAYPDISSARELESAAALAESQGNMGEALRLKLFMNLVDKRTGVKRDVLKLRNPAIKEALKALGY